MSALDGWFDVCRAGTWHDMQGREVALDEARFDRIVEAHPSADRRPLSSATKGPSVGIGEMLRAQVCEVASPRASLRVDRKSVV